MSEPLAQQHHSLGSYALKGAPGFHLFSISVWFCTLHCGHGRERGIVFRTSSKRPWGSYQGDLLPPAPGLIPGS